MKDFIPLSKEEINFLEDIAKALNKDEWNYIDEVSGYHFVFCNLCGEKLPITSSQEILNGSILFYVNVHLHGREHYKQYIKYKSFL